MGIVALFYPALTGHSSPAGGCTSRLLSSLGRPNKRFPVAVLASGGRVRKEDLLVCLRAIATGQKQPHFGIEFVAKFAI